jgi:integrase
MAKNTMKRSPKTILKLPDLEQSKTAVLNSLSSPSSRRSYDHAIRDFIDWYCSELRLAFNRTVLTRYRIALEGRRYASSTINLRLAAVRRLAYEAADCGLLSPDLAAGIRRVKGAKKLGVRTGNWLSAEQGKKLLSGPVGVELRAVRNRAILAMLIGCGLPGRDCCCQSRGLAVAGRSLGLSRPCWQRWSHAHRAHSRLGEVRYRRLDQFS